MASFTGINRNDLLWELTPECFCFMVFANFDVNCTELCIVRGKTMNSCKGKMFLRTFVRRVIAVQLRYIVGLRHWHAYLSSHWSGLVSYAHLLTGLPRGDVWPKSFTNLLARPSTRFKVAGTCKFVQVAGDNSLTLWEKDSGIFNDHRLMLADGSYGLTSIQWMTHTH